MANDKIIDRIRKLLALAQSANENEALAAATKAQALLAEYNMTMDDVGQRDDGGFIVDKELMADSRPWRRGLAANVCQLYFCDFYYHFVKMATATRKCGYVRLDRYNFVGAPHNVAVTKAVFVYLVDTIDRLASEAGKQRDLRGRVAYMTSFRHAAADRVCRRLAARYVEIMGAHTPIGNHNRGLPALYDETKQKLKAFLSDTVPDLRPVEYTPKLHSVCGAIDGSAAGDAIGLDVQLGGKSAHMMLEDKS